MTARKTTVRARLLTTAAQLFYENGITATGIDSITQNAGVAKMSLYNNFKSKDELVQVYLDARHEEWLTIYRELHSQAQNSTERVLAVFKAYIAYAEKDIENVFRGCGLINAAAELRTGTAARKAVQRHKQEVERLLLNNLLEFNNIKQSEAKTLAEHLAFILEGATAKAGLEGKSDKIHSAMLIAKSLLKA